MTLPIIFISIAAVFYTVVIFSEKIKGRLELWMILLFLFAFIFDALGTLQMAAISTNFLQDATFLILHSLLGVAVLIIMLVHLLIAVLVFVFEEYQYYFSMFSVYAWLLWMVAFLTGGYLAVSG